MTPKTVALAIYTVMSVITFIAFALDKRSAERGRRRTPESTIHVLELLGGWPGGLAAMVIIRHKNRKARYLAIVIVIVVFHAAGWWLAWR